MYFFLQYVFSIRFIVRWMIGMFWFFFGDILCKWSFIFTNLIVFIEYCLNCMLFFVRVFVLFVNRYFIYQKIERVYVEILVINIILKIYRVFEGYFI